MASVDEWAERRSWIGRLVGSGSTDPARSAPAAVIVGLLAVAAFAGSLIERWQTTTLSLDNSQSSETSVGIPVQVGSVETLGLVYVLGCLVLLTIAGAAALRADLAQRVRLATTGFGLGVAAIVVAITTRLSTDFSGQAIFGALFFPQGYEDNLTVALGTGVYLGYAAVGLPIVAVWLAAGTRRRTWTVEAHGPAVATRGAEALAPVRPAVVTPAAGTSGPAITPVAPAATPVPPAPTAMVVTEPELDATPSQWTAPRADGTRGLTVSASEPIDPSDRWRR